MRFCHLTKLVSKNTKNIVFYTLNYFEQIPAVWDPNYKTLDVPGDCGFCFYNVYIKSANIKCMEREPKNLLLVKCYDFHFILYFSSIYPYWYYIYTWNFSNSILDCFFFFNFILIYDSILLTWYTNRLWILAFPFNIRLSIHNTIRVCNYILFISSTWVPRWIHFCPLYYLLPYNTEPKPLDTASKKNVLGGLKGLKCIHVWSPRIVSEDLKCTYRIFLFSFL